MGMSIFLYGNLSKFTGSINYKYSNVKNIVDCREKNSLHTNCVGT